LHENINYIENVYEQNTKEDALEVCLEEKTHDILISEYEANLKLLKDNRVYEL